MQRRTLLKRGLLGAALLAAAGSGVLALRPGDNSVQPRRPLLSFSPAVFPVLVAVAARVTAETGADPIEIAHRVDAALQRATPEARADLENVFVLLENAFTGLLTRRSITPFTKLAGEAQDAALHAWRDGRITLFAGAYQALRKLCLAAHYATPAAWPDTGYTPMIAKPDPPPIAAREALAPPFVVDAADLGGTR